MGYGIKYSTSNVSNTLRRGNVVTTAAHNANPSENFHAGIPIEEGKHTIVKVHSTNDPDFYSLTNEELLDLVNSLGGGVESWLAAKNWINTQSDMFYLNNAVKGNIVTDGLVLYLNSKVNASFVNNKPTTNVLNNNILGHGNGATTGTDAFGDYIQLSYTAESSYSRFQLPSISVSSDETYTWSFELYATETFTSDFSWDTNEYSDQYPSSNDLSRLSYSASTPSTITAGEWTPFALTVTMKSGLTGAYTYDFFRFFYPTFQGKRIYYRNMQFERTGNGTPYAGQGTTRTQNTTWYDLSGNGNNATLVNGVTFNSGSEALVFDGTDDEATVPDNNTLDLTSNLSFEFLVKVDSSQNNLYPRLIDKSAYLVHLSQNSPFSIAQNINTPAGLKQVAIGSAFSADTWTHIITNYDGQYGKIYVNGNLKFTRDFGSVNNCNTNGTTLTIAGDTGTSRQMNGEMSLVRVYNTTLSDDDVIKNYYGGDIVQDGLVFGIDANNLVSYESGSTTTYSLTGSDSATLVNGVEFNENGYWDFAGDDEYIEIPYDSYWDTNVFGEAENFTIMCWTKCDNFYNWSSMIEKDNGGYYSESEGASLWVNASGFQAVFGNGVSGNPGGWGFNLSYATSNTTDWFHLAFTGDGTTGRFYVNGVQVGSQLLSVRSAAVTTTTNPVRFGVRGGTSNYNGKITLPLLYDRGLTAGEVQQNYIAHKARFSS